LEEQFGDETALSEIEFRERGLFEDFFDEFEGKGRTNRCGKRVDDGIRGGGHVENRRREGWKIEEEAICWGKKD
jgi:hypothetical protein